MKIFLLIVSFLLLAGCFGIAARPSIDIPGGGFSGGGDDSNPLSGWSTWGYSIGALCLLLTVLAWRIFGKRIGQIVALTGLSLIIGSYVLDFIGAHLLGFVILAFVGGLGYVAYLHRKDIKDLIDGDDTEVETAPESSTAKDSSPT